MEPVRVLIADDHAFFRAGLRGLLRLLPQVEVVGEAASGAEAAQQTSALQPDVVLMDVQMPDGNGIDATTNIVRHAGAQYCTIIVALAPNTLLLTITDDGVGLPSVRHAGVGLTTMRERAEELGGVYTINSAPRGGTQVHVSLRLTD